MMAQEKNKDKDFFLSLFLSENHEKDNNNNNNNKDSNSKENSKDDNDNDNNDNEGKEESLLLDTEMTMKEYLNHQMELECKARELMPRKFDHCSYPLGYLRQNLYICLDCTLKDCPAVICYSCSISCHTSCHIIELYSKRHFKCDCGIDSKFNTFCSLFSKKETNHENDYSKASHNFQGRFCICDKFYDDDEEDNGIMIQCLSCEDWFHSACVNAPDDFESFTHFVCKDCHGKRPELSCLLKHDSDSCCLNSHSNDSAMNMFLPQDWRENKCNCNRLLLEEFKEELVYETDLDEPIQSLDSLYMNALKILETSVNRVVAINAIEKMHDLKDSLVNFLGTLPQDHCVTKEVNTIQEALIN